jgi:hypothetical protein
MLDESWRAAESTSETFVGYGSAPLLDSCVVERRNEHTLLVRVHSVDRQGRPLPDAVFTFRKGDPQYERWERQANCNRPG